MTMSHSISNHFLQKNIYYDFNKQQATSNKQQATSNKQQAINIV